MKKTLNICLMAFAVILTACSRQEEKVPHSELELNEAHFRPPYGGLIPMMVFESDNSIEYASRAEELHTFLKYNAQDKISFERGTMNFPEATGTTGSGLVSDGEYGYHVEISPATSGDPYTRVMVTRQSPDSLGMKTMTVCFSFDRNAKEGYITLAQSSDDGVLVGKKKSIAVQEFKTAFDAVEKLARESVLM